MSNNVFTEKDLLKEYEDLCMFVLKHFTKHNSIDSQCKYV